MEKERESLWVSLSRESLQRVSQQQFGNATLFSPKCPLWARGVESFAIISAGAGREGDAAAASSARAHARSGCHQARSALPESAVASRIQSGVENSQVYIYELL